MTLESRITLLAQAIGADVKTLTNTIGVLANLTTTTKTDIVSALNEVVTSASTANSSIGTLANLTTTAKGNLVAALNEINAALGAIDTSSVIDDLLVSSLVKTWSVTKISNAISSAVAALVGSAPAALDTLNELATALGNNANLATDISTALGNRVRVDAAQTFSAGEKLQARSNIDAQSATDVGDTNHDFAGDYTAAKV